jgi:heat shock protein HslJ
MSFYSVGDELKIETGIPKITPRDDKAGVIYTAESEIFDLKANISKESCNDGMSDLQYPYSVKITITRKGYKEIREFSGCGNYTANPLINDIWALANFKGKNIKEFSGLKSRPYIEIHIKENKIAGNASCNEFYGTAEIMGDKIVFGENITRTKMNCEEMNLETDFLNALSGKTLYYRIENLKLYLIENGEVIMEFNKMD